MFVILGKFIPTIFVIRFQIEINHKIGTRNKNFYAKVVNSLDNDAYI